MMKRMIHLIVDVGILVGASVATGSILQGIALWVVMFGGYLFVVSLGTVLVSVIRGPTEEEMAAERTERNSGMYKL